MLLAGPLKKDHQKTGAVLKTGVNASKNMKTRLARQLH
jgi:hypothetical protein